MENELTHEMLRRFAAVEKMIEDKIQELEKKLTGSSVDPNAPAQTEAPSTTETAPTAETTPPSAEPSPTDTTTGGTP